MVPVTFPFKPLLGPKTSDGFSPVFTSMVDIGNVRFPVHNFNSLTESNVSGAMSERFHRSQKGLPVKHANGSNTARFWSRTWCASNITTSVAKAIFFIQLPGSDLISIGVTENMVLPEGEVTALQLRYRGPNDIVDAMQRRGESQPQLPHTHQTLSQLIDGRIESQSDLNMFNSEDWPDFGHTDIYSEPERARIRSIIDEGSNAFSAGALFSPSSASAHLPVPAVGDDSLEDLLGGATESPHERAQGEKE